MFENTIKFIASDTYVKGSKELYPTPAKTNTPDWYKNLKHTIEFKTVKGCMPFLDSLTAGYILKMPIDYYIAHNIEHEGRMKTGMASSAKKVFGNESINLNYGDQETHNILQLEGSPLVEKNKFLPVHKILNPWIIKTPPGYSCLFLPPMNNTDDRFSIIPGIVDTDSFTTQINFPFIVNGDKYPNLQTTIKVGTPYVQVIPFKRESWKMKVEGKDEKTLKTNFFFAWKYVIDNYKKKFWHKKSWK